MPLHSCAFVVVATELRGWKHSDRFCVVRVLGALHSGNYVARRFRCCDSSGMVRVGIFRWRRWTSLFILYWQSFEITWKDMNVFFLVTFDDFFFLLRTASTWITSLLRQSASTTRVRVKFEKWRNGKTVSNCWGKTFDVFFSLFPWFDISCHRSRNSFAYIGNFQILILAPNAL